MKRARPANGLVSFSSKFVREKCIQITARKMAAGNMSKHVLALVATNLSRLIIYTSHIRNIILLFRLQKLQIESIHLNFLLRKRSYAAQKVKRKRERRLYRKQRSCWYQQGRADMWWQNIIRETWKKNFRLSNVLLKIW